MASVRTAAGEQVSPIVDPALEVAVELDALGNDAGVESEELESGAQILEPFDPRLIDVTTETRTLDSLVKRLEIDQIDLDPDFQRSRGIWNPKKKSLLIESLLLRIPLPTFYVAEVEDDAALGEDRWAVVDGIQRLSTIAEFVQPDAIGEEPFRLAGLEYLQKEEGKRFDELAAALRLRILESQFTFQVIRKSTPEPVKLNIFARINTGGMPLSPQELRHALTPGPCRAVLRDLAASDAFQTAVAGSVSRSRMADREMVLRFLAFRAHNPLEYRHPDFNDFLRRAMREINSWSNAERSQRTDDFTRAMEASHRVFGDDAFRKRYSGGDPRRPVSKALFEAVAVAIARATEGADRDAVKTLASRAREVKRGFIELMSDPKFDRSISQGTGDPIRVRHRFGALEELMRSVTK
jgi:hypothetical protein